MTMCPTCFDDDKRLRRMAAKDAVEYLVNRKESKDLQDPLATIGLNLEQQKGT